MTDDGARPLPPGSMIGILGGGQLGRMTAVAAARLGYDCHIFCPDKDSPASRVAAATTVAAYDDEQALRRFAGSVDAVTLEFENIPAETAALLAEFRPLRPGWRVLETTQDRASEKRFTAAAGLGTAPWAPVDGPQALAAALDRLGRPALLKSRRLGYDGKGQVRIDAGDHPAAAWAAMGAAGGGAILEGMVDFACEVSVIVARGANGTTACFDTVENRHAAGILDVTVAPARIDAGIADSARAAAVTLAEAFGLVGLLAVEMFVTRDGRVLVNEMAPRPHNSGHWTIDGCAVSQFEQLVRAVAGLPLGDPSRHSDAVMKNLIGDAADGWPALVAEPGLAVHLYGKRETRPGRKMGHVTRLYPRGAGANGWASRGGDRPPPQEE
ncbi:MAG: 5-(carboxyamino)imidazole ribonucleotide synthase [Acetobacterales bacterium]